MLRRSFLRFLGCLPVLFASQRGQPQQLVTVGLDIGRIETKGLLCVRDAESMRVVHVVDVVFSRDGRMVAAADSHARPC